MAKPASGTTLNSGHALYTNLLAVWAFLENTGTTINDSKGTNTGTLLGGSSWGTDSAGDPCISVATGSANALSLTSLIDNSHATSFSIAFRAKQTASNAKGGIFGAGTGASIGFMFGGVGFQARLKTVALYGDWLFTGSTTFTTEADYVLTYDHAAGSNRLRFYKNGTEDSASPLAGDSDSYLYIDRLLSGHDGSGTLGLEGTCSYVYVWDGRVLSQSEAASLNSSPYGLFGASPSGPVSRNLFRNQAVKRSNSF